MTHLKIFLLLLTGFLFLQCSEQKRDEPSDHFKYAQDNGGIILPDGFQAIVVTDSVGPARHIAIRDNGDIYVALRSQKNGGGIAAMRDTDGDGIADQVQYFGEAAGTGIDIHDGYLYYSSNTEVFRVPLDDNLVPAGKPETVISGFPEQKQHASKPFTFDGSGHIYVTVGGPSNACQEEMRTKESPGMNPCPQLELHGGVWRFSADKTNQTQEADGHRYATGIRNAVALDWNFDANALYAVQHGRDQLSTLWPQYYNDEQNAQLPSEDFLMLEDGADFGWPYTYYDGQKNQRMVAPEYGGDGEMTAEEGKYEDPLLAFPGHWAPNDMVFYDGDQFPDNYLHGAFIAFHGSWNRAPEPQAGYNVAFVPMSGKSPSADYEVFADGFSGKDSFTSPSDAISRPTGLAVGPDGSLYVTDSVKGKIWRIMYNKR